MPLLELTDEQALALLEQLSEEQKKRLLARLSPTAPSGKTEKRPVFGSAKNDILYMAEDKKESAFEYAIESGNTDVVNAFLAHGASVEARDKWGATPLVDAVMSCQPAIVNVLLARGADPNASDLMPPLIDAAQDGPEI